MIQIDDTLLDQLGVAKDSDYRTYMSDNLINLLSLRVANAVTALLSDEQLDELDRQDDHSKQEWLTTHVSGFEEIVKRELEETISEIKRTTA